jgi:GTP-binding protein EngB required for normal cell division
MFAGDLAIHKINKKAVILLGDSRTGKSTLFNHLLNVLMQGKQVGRRDVQL